MSTTELAVASVQAGTNRRRVGDYPQLLARVGQAALLDRRPTYYAARIAVTAAVVVARRRRTRRCRRWRHRGRRGACEYTTGDRRSRRWPGSRSASVSPPRDAHAARPLAVGCGVLTSRNLQRSLGTFPQTFSK
jgi:hypothetical protein